jgi:hypothetical protein
MNFAKQKGNVIAYVVIAMTTIAALAVGALYMTSSSALGELGANNLNRAYFLALAGKDYALINNLEDTMVKYPGGRIFTFANGDKFQLVIKCPDNTIQSTGIVNEGTPQEVRRTTSIAKTGFCSRHDISGFTDMTKRNQPGSSFVQVDATDSTATLGGGESGKFGALVYGGTSIQGGCGIPPLPAGECKLGSGFRAFFVFQFGLLSNGQPSSGDGFTFTFFNGGVDNNGVKINDQNAVGGDNGRGELLGYAGDSRYYDSNGMLQFLDGRGGRGIQPPKVAVEFDVYPNFDSSDVCASGSRRDGLDSRNHVAYVFWGDNTNSSCTSTVGRNTYDDNRHNAGTDGPTDPRNSRRPTDGADTSYYDAASSWPVQTNWMLSNTPTNIYVVRVEVTRSATPNATGNYDYTMNTWIKLCPVNDITCPAYDDTSTFANTKIGYGVAVPGDTSTLSRTFSLSSVYHQNFDTFYFGWTAAMGGATQNVMINRFRMNFLK